MLTDDQIKHLFNPGALAMTTDALEAVSVALGEEVVDEFSCFFRKLGYHVTWDYDRKGKYYEIYTQDEPDHPGRLICQCPFGIPLSVVLQDLPWWAEDKKGDSGVDYVVNGKLADVAAIWEQVKIHQANEKENDQAAALP
jgi:hypothetical protein